MRSTTGARGPFEAQPASKAMASTPAQRTGREAAAADAPATDWDSVSCNCPLSIRFSCLLKIVFRP
ncbi:Uncharacterised protein [Bordetella pertussis]|nr:Uncharacterised protein [Bordetella pertussis]CFW31208.1 Uncharacterised protein [Bordetella pertussis]